MQHRQRLVEPSDQADIFPIELAAGKDIGAAQHIRQTVSFEKKYFQAQRLVPQHQDRCGRNRRQRSAFVRLHVS